MRRHDRETSYRDAVAILQGCRYVTIAFHGGEYPYAVPMHFGLTEEAGALTLWFHGADEGKKLDLLRRDGRVAFSAVRFCTDVPPSGEAACTATARFESVFGEGELLIAAECEKERGAQGAALTRRDDGYAPARGARARMRAQTARRYAFGKTARIIMRRMPHFLLSRTL